MTEAEKKELLEMYTRDKGLDSLAFLKKSLHGKTEMTEEDAREDLYRRIFKALGISAGDVENATEKAWEWAFGTFDSQASPEDKKEIGRKILEGSW